MGYVTGTNPLITTNTNWLDRQVDGPTTRKMDPVSIAAHWMHEWLHVAGLRHRSSDRVDRRDAVYSIGSIMAEIGRDMARQSIMMFDQLFSETWGDGYLAAVEAGAKINEHACGCSD